ncbi:hypothetical protein [Burkholderia vietnamiensis]|uniref:hypothetical protein n=1 Tax=Burkholderia vietnamiensis TaxID=60552 RepID=UPI00075A2002|nr:hypothetical protein [Burkholderia vietnamiensis]KVE71048.1 extensin [Burkholderia vietnamiensis]
MTSTRKTLWIAGGLLVAAAGAGYVMLLRADHRAIAEAGIGDAAAPAATAPADGRTAQGAIAPPAPDAAPSAHVDEALPQQAAARDRSVPASAAVAQVAPAAPVAAVPAPKPAAPPPAVHVVAVEPADSTPTNAKPAQLPPAAPQTIQPAQPPRAVQPAAPVDAAQAPRSGKQPSQPTRHAARTRDGLERHAATAQPAQRAETPETRALVRESAKLDPSLPPPQYVATPGFAQPHAAAGTNPVAAAMTEQLVRQSSTIRTTPASTNGAPAAP